MNAVTAVETTFVPDASSAQLSSRARVGFAPRRHTDRADVADVTDVPAGLVCAVDVGPDEFEVGVGVHGPDRMPADTAGCPLDDSDHAAYCRAYGTRISSE